MKTPSSRGAATRKKILDAAADLIIRHGFNGTSVDDILVVSGTGKSQFYHYFASKSQLARELVAYYTHAMPLAVILESAPFREISDFETALDKMLAAHRNGQFPHGCPNSNLATELVTNQSELTECFQQIFTDIQSKFVETIKYWRLRGIVHQDIEPGQVANFVIGSIEGAILLAKITSSSEAVADTISQIKRYLQSLSSKLSAKPQIRLNPKPASLTYCP